MGGGAGGATLAGTGFTRSPSRGAVSAGGIAPGAGMSRASSGAFTFGASAALGTGIATADGGAATADGGAAIADGGAVAAVATVVATVAGPAVGAGSLRAAWTARAPPTIITTNPHARRIATMTRRRLASGGGRELSTRTVGFSRLGSGSVTVGAIEAESGGGATSTSS